MSPTVNDYVVRHGIEFQCIKHRAITSIDEASALMPDKVDRFVKSLVFQGGGSGDLWIIAMPGRMRADYAAIARATETPRKELKLASAETVSAILDMDLGAVLPVPLGGSRVVVDPMVLDLEYILVGSGRRDCTLEMRPSAIVSLPNVHIQSICRS